MLAYLAYFQFAFLYLLVVAIGLVVYGSDFKGIAGWIYIIPLLVLTVAHHWVWPLRQQLSSAKGIRIVCGTGAVVALLAYSPMHMGYWDEHSLWQAVLMAGLGICSYLLSIIAAAKITPATTSPPTTTPPTTSYRNSPVWVLALIGLFWLLAKQYPLVVLLCLALVFIISAFWLPPPEQTGGVKLPAKSRSDPFAKYTIFLTAIDLSCVVWDFEIDTRWAWYVAVGFLAAAVGYYVGRGDNKSDQLEQGVYFAAIVNFVAAALWSPYIVWFLHVGIAGFCMGYLLPAAIFKANDPLKTQPVLGWTVWFFMGVVLSNAWYANLLWASTRVVLVLPFAILVILYIRFRISAMKTYG